MKFSKRQDIEAPAETVFAAIADFAAIEAGARQRGIEVARADALAEPGPGMVWKIRAPVRGRPRDIRLALARWQPHSDLALVAESAGLTGDVTFAVLALSPSRSRLQVGIDLRAGTLTARLLLHSLKLAKSALDRRFAQRVASFAARIEERQGRLQPRRGSAG